MNWPPFPRFLLDENTSGSPAGGTPAPSEGGTPAPSSTSPGSADSGAGAAPTEVVEREPASGRDPFDGMDSIDFDAIDIGPPEAETGDEPGSAAGAPVAAGTEGEPKPAAPAVQPAQPQAPVAPSVPVVPPAENVGPPRSQLEQAMEGFKTAANQTALADWAAGNLFKLSDEDIAAFDANAADAIPKFMGRVYTQAMQSAVNLIKNLVPEMVNSGISTQQTRAQRANEALSEFYQTNPHLSADQHGAAVDRWAKSFRAQNPSASRADAIAFVGRAVSAEFGVWPGATNGSGAGSRKAPPFAPARQGGRAPASQKGPHDPYAGMEDEYD